MLKIRENRKICREKFMANVINNYKKNINTFWKFVNGSVTVKLVKIKLGH